MCFGKTVYSDGAAAANALSPSVFLVVLGLFSIRASDDLRSYLFSFTEISIDRRETMRRFKSKKTGLKVNAILKR